jgi:D-glycero-alpha-D-manno-heptose 1-phosphate guanylyltransferase
MALCKLPDTGRYGQVVVENNVITAFAPGKVEKAGYINAGIYVIDPALFTGFAMPETFSFEQDFLQPHIATLKPHAYIADNYFIDIGIPADYARACAELPEVVGK